MLHDPQTPSLSDGPIALAEEAVTADVVLGSGTVAGVEADDNVGQQSIVAKHLHWVFWLSQMMA